MNRLLTILFLTLFALPAFACDFSGVPNLTAVQRASLEADCKASQKANTTIPDSVADQLNASVSPEALSGYGKVAKEFAEAIGIAAKELGVAANDFLNTPAGKLTAVIIVWRVMGDDVYAIAAYPFRLLIGTALLILIWTYVRRIHRSVFALNITYESVPVFYGLFSYRRAVTVAAPNAEMNDSELTTMVVSYAVAIVSTFIVVAWLMVP